MEYSEELIKQYRTIQESGITNMLDRQMIVAVSGAIGFDELYDLASDRRMYAKFLSSYKPEWLDVKPDDDIVERLRKLSDAIN